MYLKIALFVAFAINSNSVDIPPIPTVCPPVLGANCWVDQPPTWGIVCNGTYFNGAFTIPFNYSNDIVILIDGSSSMNQNRLQKIQDALVSLFNQQIFLVNQYIHLGILFMENGNVTTLLPLTGDTNYPTVQTITTAIQNHAYVGGQSKLRNGLKSALGLLADKPAFGGPNDRPNVENSLIVITAPTTDKNYDYTTIRNQSALAETLPGTLFAVGFNDAVNAQLEGLSALSIYGATPIKTVPANLTQTVQSICYWSTIGTQ